MKEKFQGGLLGLAAGDMFYPKNNGRYSEETQIALEIATLLHQDGNYEENLPKVLKVWAESHKDNKDIDLMTFFAFENGHPMDSTSGSLAAFAVPAGFYHFRNIPKAIDCARTTIAQITVDSSCQCSCVAAALMGLYAVMDVPFGVWASELMSFVRGIDNDLVDSIKTTMDMSASSEDIESFGKFSKQLNPCESVVCSSLFACVHFHKNFGIAIEVASELSKDPDAATALTGACLGAKFGMKAIPEDLIVRLENKEDILNIGEKLFYGSMKANPV